MQLSATYQAIPKDRLCWLFNKCQMSDRTNTVMADSKMSFATSKLRQHFFRTLRSHVKEQQLAVNSVFVFGGILRREMAASFQLQRVWEQNPTQEVQAALSHKIPNVLPVLHVPQDCFVASQTDVDVYFQKEEDKQKFIRQLHSRYKVGPVQSCALPQYAGLSVHTFKLRPNLTIFGPVPVVKVDLVTKCSQYCCFLPDFSVNRLKMTTDRKIGIFDDVPPFQSKSVLGTAIQEALKVAEVITEISNKSTRLILYSFSSYQDQFTRHCEALSALRPSRTSPDDSLDESERTVAYYYSQYTRKLLTMRLPLMLNDGWRVSNLKLSTYQTPKGVGVIQLSCGDAWNPKKDQYRIESSVCEVCCSVCDCWELLFEDFS